MIWAVLSLVALSLAGAGFLGWRARQDGINQARRKADDETLRQVEMGDDVARKVDALPDGAADRELRKSWSR